MALNPPRIEILGVRVDNCTMAEVVSRLRHALGAPHGELPLGFHVVTVNPEFIMEAQRNEPFRRLINTASLVIPDGFGLQLMCKGFGYRLQGRVTGADLMVELARVAEEEGKAIFLFGAPDGVATQAAVELKRRFPSLVVAGAENEFDEHGNPRADSEVLDRIRRTSPEVLFVALGAPKQEEWIAAALPSLPTVRVAIGVGGSFDYLAGRLRRAPAILRALGLEWLWRLLLQPSRFGRIVTATIRFPLAILRRRNAIHPFEQ